MSGRILVTGASGFVGSALVRRLALDRALVRAISHTRPVANLAHTVDAAQGPDLRASSDWRPYLHTCETVVHTAARVHVMRESAVSAQALYRATNVLGTVALARQAAESGVKRFVFLSSVKVLGESTERGSPFTDASSPVPIGPYAESKLEAEEALCELARIHGMEVVSIRPVLVYGPGVQANFAQLMRWIDKGFPLPFATIRNVRSFLFVDNLVDFVVRCIHHPNAANRRFLVSDDLDVSTPDLALALGTALRKSVRLVAVPTPLLRFGARCLGFQAQFSRLSESLQVRIDGAKHELQWVPPVSFEEGLFKTAIGFRSAP
jgi:nucleoside-diphosphate-sugar epimerase